MSQDSKARQKWLVPDEIWEELKPLTPTHVNTRPQGGGTQFISDREVMNGIFFVLNTVCQWNALDATIIASASATHRRFLQWIKSGVFESFWKMELKKYDRVKGIGWRRLSLDASLCKAPIAGSLETGKNPTDRGKQGIKRSIIVDSRGIPISIVVAPANRHESLLLMDTIRGIAVHRPKPTRTKPQHLYLDKGYDVDWIRTVLPIEGFIPHIPFKDNRKLTALQKREMAQDRKRKPRRWMVERTFGWFNRDRAILIRWEKNPLCYRALLHIAAGITCFKKSQSIRN